MSGVGRKARRRSEDSAALVVTCLTEERLRTLYTNDGLSMAAIARIHGCSKQYVSQLCRRYLIRRRATITAEHGPQ